MLENREYAGHVVGGALVGVAVGMAIQKILSPRSAKVPTPDAAIASQVCVCGKKRAPEAKNNLRVPLHREAAPRRNGESHHGRHSPSPSTRSKSHEESWKKCRSPRDEKSDCSNDKVPRASSRHIARTKDRSRSKGRTSASRLSDCESSSSSLSTTRNDSGIKMAPESPWDLLLPVDASTRYPSVVFPKRKILEVEASKNVGRRDAESSNFAVDSINDNYSRAEKNGIGFNESGIDDSQESSSVNHSYRFMETSLDSSKFRSLPIFYESNICDASQCDEELKRCSF